MQFKWLKLTSRSFLRLSSLECPVFLSNQRFISYSQSFNNPNLNIDDKKNAKIASGNLSHGFHHSNTNSSNYFTKYVILSAAFIFTFLTSYVACENENSKAHTDDDLKKSYKTSPNEKIPPTSSDKLKKEDFDLAPNKDDKDNKNDKKSEDTQSEQSKASQEKESEKTYESPSRKEKEMPYPENGSLITLKFAKNCARSLLNLQMAEVGAPGISIAVSIDGKLIYAEGLGFADVENHVQCSAKSVMRIASISKPMTAVVVSKLCEEGKLDLDAPIQRYLPNYPIKKIDGKEVTITTRNLLSHTSGMRHYSLMEEEQNEEDDKINQRNPRNVDPNDYQSKRRQIRRLVSDLAYPIKKKAPKKQQDEFDLEEYYIKENFKSVTQSLELFKDDDLFFEPGKDFKYTTHGFTLISAIIEAASGKKFEKVMQELFHDMNLHQTFLENDDTIIYKRARYYVRGKNDSNLRNAPYVNNSYKYAGGGILSSTIDLVRFGNAMLYSFQYKEGSERVPGILKPSSVQEMWTPQPAAAFKNRLDASKYALGWEVIEEKTSHPFCRRQKFMAAHSGGAVGASSYMLIYPTKGANNQLEGELPKGIVVAVLCNLQSVSLSKVCKKIAYLFERVEDQSSVLGTISGSNAKVYKA